MEGSFSSYFTDKPSPLLKGSEASDEPEPTEQQEKIAEEQIIFRQIDKSPDSARIILFASNSFLSDTILGISSGVMRTNYLEPIQLMANAVDWSLEDRELLSIRGRSHFSRPLLPVTKDVQLFWEYLNYTLVLVGLVTIWIVKLFFHKRSARQQLAYLQQTSGRV